MTINLGDVSVYHQVSIIESPSSNDNREGRNEGEALSKALSLAKVSHHYYRVSDERELNAVFRRMEEDTAISLSPECVQFPALYIHFSAHGNESGIGLSNGDFLSWSSLGDKLLDFAGRTGRIFPECPASILSLCFSVCYGLHAVKTAHNRTAIPFYAVIGPPNEVGWSDSLTAFVVFYHNVCHKQVDIAEGIRRMNAAVGDEAFYPIVWETLVQSQRP